jgi:hypothetical protein
MSNPHGQINQEKQSASPCSAVFGINPTALTGPAAQPVLQTLHLMIQNGNSHATASHSELATQAMTPAPATTGSVCSAANASA